MVRNDEVKTRWFSFMVPCHVRQCGAFSTSSFLGGTSHEEPQSASKGLKIAQIGAVARLLRGWISMLVISYGLVTVSSLRASLVLGMLPGFGLRGKTLFLLPEAGKSMAVAVRRFLISSY